MREHDFCMNLNMMERPPTLYLKQFTEDGPFLCSFSGCTYRNWQLQALYRLRADISDYFPSESLCSFKHFVSFVSRIPEEFCSHAHLHNRNGRVCHVLRTSASSYGCPNKVRAADSYLRS
jgi:hypothetical protein